MIIFFEIIFNLIWFIVVSTIIFSIIKATKNTNKSVKTSFTTMDEISKIIKEKTDNIRNQNYKYSNNNRKDSQNSYYNKEKISSYERQDENHNNHKEDEDIDLNKSIGYKKCPKCKNMISIKSEECFICSYKFKS